ncbi:barstar family protein [Streptomyces sp. NPDC049577]|uniref:barstar family protein n=1 Tax=Streptomyces sp. NPDC049577 TaxID=3155153 RepID=UPI003414AF6F
MRAEDHTSWDRTFPVRHLLVRQDEDDRGRLWARCAGVEGLFMDDVPPPREVLTLRGCAPLGPLREALSATRPLGDVCVEVWDDHQPLQWWTLVDTVVIACRPNSEDPSLVDVTVGAGVKEKEVWSHDLPLSPRFRLFTSNTVAAIPAGHCAGVDGMFAERKDPPPTPIGLIGCAPEEPLLAVLRKPRRWERDWAGLWTLDRNGRKMHEHMVGLSITSARPSVLGGTLIDITLTAGGDDRPPLAARPVWAAWHEGIPSTPNQWALHTSQGRTAWLDLTATGMSEQGPDRSGGVHHLDGRFVTDAPGLHCAMAEALVGPGRYFGRGWASFQDCLHGGFGIAAPFTLVWHDADVARKALAEEMSDPERGLSYFEDVVQLLERSGVEVVLR